MGSAYRLKDDGYPWKKIYHGRQWVGRVIKHATVPNKFIGSIKSAQGQPYQAEGRTELEAFEEVVAKRCGYKSAAEMDARNAKVRAENRVRNARHRDLANRFMRGDLQAKFDVIDEILGLPHDQAARDRNTH
jgi:hypothetical protein